VTDSAPVPYVAAGRTNVFSPMNQVGDQTAQMRAMGQVGVLFAMIDKLSTGVASANWRLYRKARSGRKEDRIEVTEHPALVVLNKPNPFYTRQELFEASQQHQDLTGETWWVLARNARVGGLPVEIWPVRPDRMQPVTSPTEFITGYVYTDPDGRKVPLDLNDVIFIRRPNPLDPFRGIGPVQSVLAYIDGEHYSAMWNRNFFLNGAIPGGIIEVEKRLSDPEFDQMSARWKEQHQGIANAHRVAILEQAKWIDVKYTQEDMQFAQLSALSDEKIRQALGFPKPMLGTVEDVNRANAEAAAFVFAAWCLVPRLDRMRAALNADFLPKFPASDGLEFDYDSPVPEDEAAENTARTSKVDAVTKLVAAGFDAAEVLEWAEMPALTYSKPAPPALPGPPPGQGGAGLDTEKDPARTEIEKGADEGAQTDAVYQLGRFIMEAPEGAERERRIEALRALARAADAQRDRALPW
jgi:HK97 family phage portal protein